MTELASRIGKRVLYGNLTWTRPGLEEEKQQAEKMQGISFGNGHRLSAPTWDPDAMDLDSEASSGDEAEERGLRPAGMTRPTTSVSPTKILRNRVSGTGRATDPKATTSSLMDRLDVGVLAETGSSATSESSYMETVSLVNNEKHLLSNGTNANTHPAIADAVPSTPTSKMVNGKLSKTPSKAPVVEWYEEMEAIPGLSIAQTPSVVRRDTEDMPAASNSSRLVDSMRQLLIPLVVKQAGQGSISSVQHLGLAQKVITDEICEQFIRQAIAFAPVVDKVGKGPQGRCDSQVTETVATSRLATPMPPGLGLGITTKKLPSISSASNLVRSPNVMDSGKIMPPSHTPPTTPRKLRENEAARSRPNVARYREDAVLPQASLLEGKVKDCGIHAGPPRDAHEYYKPPQLFSPVKSASIRRRSTSRDGSRGSRRRSRSREPANESYRPRERHRSPGSSSHRHRRSSSPSPSKGKDDYRSTPRWQSRSHRQEEKRSYQSHSKNAPHSPAASTSSLKFPPDRGRALTRSRSRTRSPTQRHRLPATRKSYSPIQRNGSLRGWSQSPPARKVPGGPYPKKGMFNPPTDRHHDYPMKPPNYMDQNSFKGHGYHSYRSESSRGDRSPPPNFEPSPTFAPPATAPLARASTTKHPRWPFVTPQDYVPLPQSAVLHRRSVVDSRTGYRSSQPAPEPISTPTPGSVHGLRSGLHIGLTTADHNAAFALSYYNRSRDANAAVAAKIEEAEPILHWDAVFDNPIALGYGSGEQATMVNAHTVNNNPPTDGELSKIINVDEDWEPPGLTLAATTSSKTINVASTSTPSGSFRPIQWTTTLKTPKHTLSVFDEAVNEEHKPSIEGLEKLVASMRHKRRPAHPLPLIPPSSFLSEPMQVDSLLCNAPPAQSPASSQTSAVHRENIEEPVLEPADATPVRAEEEGGRAKELPGNEGIQGTEKGRDNTNPIPVEPHTFSHYGPAEEPQEQGVDAHNSATFASSQHDADLQVQVPEKDTKKPSSTARLAGEKEELRAAMSAHATPSDADVPPSLAVPGTWLMQRAASTIAVVDQIFVIDEQTAARWNIAASSKSSDAANENTPVASGRGSAFQGESQEQKVKPKVKLQVLCFLNEQLDALDWKSEPSALLNVQETWPEIGDFMIILNHDEPSKRVWWGEHLPYNDGTGPAVRMERYVQAGTNSFRIITHTDVSRYTFVLFAQPRLAEPTAATMDAALSTFYDEYLDKIRDELLEWTKTTLQPGISGSAKVISLTG